MLQEKLNPEGLGLRRGGFLFKTNDKVMQIRNNYDKEVFNGDIGTVSSVSMEDRELAVTFDDRTVTYDVSAPSHMTFRNLMSWYWHMRPRSTRARAQNIRS